MALPDKHQLKFNIHKDSKTLMEAIEKRFGGNKETKKRNKIDLEEQSLDDLFNSLKIYEAEPISAASVSAISAKLPVSALLNVDTLSNAVIYSFFASQSNSPQLDNDDLKQIDADDLEEIDLKWQMAMLIVKARKGHFARECRSPKDTRKNEEEPTNYALMAFTSLSSSSSDNESDESLAPSPIYDRYQSGDRYHVVLPPYTGTFMPPKPDLVFHNAPNVVETVHITFNVKLSPTNPEKYVSLIHRPLAPIYEDWISDSKDDSETKILQNVPSFVQPNEKVKTPRPSVSLNRKACFVCKSLTHLIKDCDNYDQKMAQTPVRNHAQNGNLQQYTRMTLLNPQWHVVPTTVLTKSKLVPITAARPVTDAAPKPHLTRPRQAKPAVTKPYLPPRRHINHSSSPKASNFPLKVTAAKAPMVNAVKSVRENRNGNLNGNPQHALNDKGVIDSGCSRHMIGNMSYLSDFEAINGGYVAFGRNPTGGKISKKGEIRTGKLDFDIVYFVKELKFNLFSVSQMCDKKNNVLFTDTKCLVLSPEFKLPNENQVLLRVPRENNMYNVDLKNIVPSGVLTCLFAKATLDESNLWHRRKVDEGFLVGYSISSKAFRVFNSRTRIIQETLHINFLENKPNVAGSGSTWMFDIDTLTKTMNYQPVTAGNQSNPSAGIQEQFDAEKAGDENVQQYVLFLVWSSSSNNPQNTDGDVAFEVKEPEFERRKPGSEVNVSLSSSAQSKKHDDKTKREAKGKSPVNVAGSLAPAIGQISSNSTNTFSTGGPSNTVVSPTHGKSLYVDTSQLSDDQNMSELEDITYSDNKEDVGAEADFTNLETTITNVWVLVDLPNGKRAIEKGIDYEEVFAPVARIEAIRLFLAYASFMGFMVYQMDVKSDFLYGTIEEEVYVCQPPGFKDPGYHDKVYKVVKALYGLHQAPRDLCKAFEKLMKDKFQISAMGELTFFLGLQVKQKEDGIFISQDKYVAVILRKFGLTDGKSASTPIDTKKPLLKDPDVKRIFRYLKGKPHLDLWYPKDSPFNLVAYSDSDCAGASLDRKSTTGGCQFLGGRLISWQCKKQIVVATSSTEAEYVAAASCCAQVIWIQNQLLDYGFLGTKLMKKLELKFVLLTYVTAVRLNVTAISSKFLLFDASEGFNQFIDFLNASSIKYALNVNPNIYVSCIKQFWTFVSVKIVNDVPRLQALVDKKKVIITKATIRDALRLNDAKGINYLPNEEIFTELVRMGYEKPSTKLTFYKAFFLSQWKFLIHTILLCMSAKRTSWNEFSLSMALAVICLSTSRKFTFSKYIFDSLVRNVDSFTKFYMVRKGFSRVDTPLFEGMIVAHQVGEGDVEVNVDDVSTIGVADEGDATVADDDVSTAGRIIAYMDADEDVTLKDVANIAKEVAVYAEIEESVLSMQDDEIEPVELQEVVEVVTPAKLMTEVVTTASANITAADAQIPAVAPTLTTAPSVARRRKGVVIRDPEETATSSTIIHTEP
uniref:Uncharacterized mitochondrial protein AtMg00810-like n=1 Tax=Tanacetum cinerariifolium TaxID=118510 RepID=A0A6L2LJF3_TANCI|nr:uncharacterized mitochondrial protein AtMg00810-like [Tanacetum cinerariifolium]